MNADGVQFARQIMAVPGAAIPALFAHCSLSIRRTGSPAESFPGVGFTHTGQDH